MYGIITDDKFFERAKKFMLYKNTDGKYFTKERIRRPILKLSRPDKDKKPDHPLCQ